MFCDWTGAMIAKPQHVTEACFLQFARDWFQDIASGAWQKAFDRLDLPPNFGDPYTPELFREEVEKDHFCEGTVFREQHPEGVIYSDPSTIGESKYAELYPLRSDEPTDEGVLDDPDEELRRCLREGLSVQLEHPVPLNGEWSDLTACFQFVDQGDSYAVRLEWLNVL
jgi:hypothetical protein